MKLKICGLLFKEKQAIKALKFLLNLCGQRFQAKKDNVQ